MRPSNFPPGSRPVDSYPGGMRQQQIQGALANQIPPMLQQQQHQQQSSQSPFISNANVGGGLAGYMNPQQLPQSQVVHHMVQHQGPQPIAQQDAGQQQRMFFPNQAGMQPPPQQHQQQQGFGYMPVQQQSLSPNMGSGIDSGMIGTVPAGNVGTILCNVWNSNLEEQFEVIRAVVSKFKYVSVDCKFPGVVARPIGTFKTTSEYHYQTLRSNVDILNVTQVGLAFSDEKGNRPAGVPSTWQFNFKFSTNSDMYSSDGIELLKQSGIDLAKHEEDGVDPFEFGELILSSGLVLDDSVNWITFHGGYDLGYLLSIMLNKEIPVEEQGFLKAMNLYFPSVWDVKYMVKNFNLCNKSTLSEVAEEFHIGGAYLSGNGMRQAGSEALLTKGCYLEARKLIDDEIAVQAKGFIFGIGDFAEDRTDRQQQNQQHQHHQIHNHHHQQHQQQQQQQGRPILGNERRSMNNAANVFQFGKMGGG
jgi:CCR4-NOT transcription complex subunit 7/8